MPGLLDIASLSTSVEVETNNGNQKIECRALTARGIAILLDRFPVLRELFTGKTPDMSPDMVLKMVPESVAVVIAIGIGKPGDAEAEAWADALPAQIQAECVKAILDRTMPKGVGPFVETLTAICGTVAGSESISIPDGKSQPQSSGSQEPAS